MPRIVADPSMPRQRGTMAAIGSLIGHVLYGASPGPSPVVRLASSPSHA